jgi:DNA-binding transcriptional ArsR family regulator
MDPLDPPTAAHAGRRKIAPPGAPTPRRAAAPTDAAALVRRIVACIGAHPGSTIGQLAPYVGVHETTLRRHLHRLAHDGVIRIEERPSARFGGQMTRLYFCGEPAADVPSGPAAACAEAA